MKEILIYDPIYSWTVIPLIKELEDSKDSDIKCRVNSPGGEVYYAYGIIAKYLEHSNAKVMQVDGIAASAAAILCCAADSVECLDVSKFLFHRAAFAPWIEGDANRFTDDMRADLEKMNKELRAIMEGRFTAAEWEKVTGVSLDSLFSLDARIDVTIDAKQAKKLGIVSKIVPITPAKKAEIESLSHGMAARYIPEIPKASAEQNTITQNKNRKMTSQEIKAQHPEAWQAIYNEGVTAEKDRVEAYMVFSEVDPAAVKAGIEGGKALTTKEMAAFTLKAASNAKLTAMQAENAPDVETPEAEKGKQPTAAEAKNEAAFDSEWKAQANVKA